MEHDTPVVVIDFRLGNSFELRGRFQSIENEAKEFELISEGIGDLFCIKPGDTEGD